jgi:antitoxin component of MazEF toxin-antitoxin module
VAEFISKVTYARPNSPSLRTTIPEGLAKMIGLEAGDSLVWNLTIKDNNLIVTVSKELKEGK